MYILIFAKRTSVLGLWFLHMSIPGEPARAIILETMKKPEKTFPKTKNGAGFSSALVLAVCIFQDCVCFEGLNDTQKN